MALVDVDEIVKRLRPGTAPPDKEWVAAMVDATVEQIELAFMVRGRDFTAEVEASAPLKRIARALVIELVAETVIAGGRKGIKSVSSATGPVSDAETYAVVTGAGWAGPVLSAAHLALLGLTDGGPRGRFPAPLRWPEEIPPGGRRGDC